MISPSSAPDAVQPRHSSVANRAAIAIALMIGFYVLALGLSGALLVAGSLLVLNVRETSAAGIKFGFLAILGGLTILWSLRPRRDEFEAPGPELSRADQPELFDVLDGVAQVTKQTMPEVVYASGDFNAGVTNRGGSTLR